MRLTRRDFLRASAAIIAARGLKAMAAPQLEEALAGKVNIPVVWLQGAGCNGDSVSLLNSIYYATAESLLRDTISLKYHPTLMGAAGESAVTAAKTARASGGYILAIEGAIPTGAEGKYCTIWPGMTMQDALITYSENARFILAVGTCAAYGGVAAGSPNPTASKGVSGILNQSKKLINVPGCPAHPDWIVGTIAYLLANGHAPPLDKHRRPKRYFGKCLHDGCEESLDYDDEAERLSQRGCLEGLGCKGASTYADCYKRKFNSGAAGRYGVNWCVEARSPCIGCVQPSFPDGMSPFFVASEDDEDED
jgi:hydrogenase small subunit